MTLAAENGNVAVSDYLIKRGADPLYLDNYGRDARWYAAQKGHKDIENIIDKELRDRALEEQRREEARAEADRANSYEV